jgi:hypothetical protein
MDGVCGLMRVSGALMDTGRSQTCHNAQLVIAGSATGMCGVGHVKACEGVL